MGTSIWKFLGIIVVLGGLVTAVNNKPELLDTVRLIREIPATIGMPMSEFWGMIILVLFFGYIFINHD